MKRKTKMILYILLVLLIIIVVIGLIFWRQMQKPLYSPGNLASNPNLSAPLTPPSQPAESSYWDMGDGVSLYHFGKGNGRNVVVIHGGPGYPDREFWTGLKPLTNEYRFHFYDQRGCGDSTRPIKSFASKNYYRNVQQLERMLGLGTQIADIERIRHILGDEKLILIGHSFGAFIASLYAVEFPERVAGLILLSPADMLVMPQESGGLFEIIEAGLPEGDKPKFNEFMADYFNFGTIFTKTDDDLVAANDKLAEYYTRFAEQSLNPMGHETSTAQARSGGWMVFGMYFSMGQAHDYRDALRAVTAPALVLRGDGDFQSTDVEKMYVDAIPNARMEVIQGVTHFMYEEKPEEFTETVGRFLGSLQ